MINRIMNLFSNPIILCGSIAAGIVLLLVIVVVICCRKSAADEREELKALSEEIEADLNDEIVETVEEQKIENVLSKMQEALDTKEENAISFEQEQEENAIISYQELLNSLGAKSSIDVDSIELYDDELDGQIEISDFNKEIIDAYQNEDMSREFYKFQNDYSSENLALNVSEESPVMNFDFSMSDVEFVDDGDIVDCEEIEPQAVLHNKAEVKELVKRFVKTDGDNPAIIVDNADWICDKSYVDFMRDIGVHFNVKNMLAADCYKKIIMDVKGIIKSNELVDSDYICWRL